MEHAMTLPDKSLIAARFAAAAPHYNRHAEAQRQIHAELAALLAAHAPSSARKVLEIGCGTGLFSRILAAQFPQAQLVLNDLHPDCTAAPSGFQTAFAANGFMPEYRFGDAEHTDFGSGYDAVCSASALQWLADPAAFLTRAAAMLVSDGLLVFNTFTPANLHQIRALTNQGLDYPEAAQWQAWLARDYEILSLHSETITLSFDTPRQVLRHLQATGVTATGSGFAWTKQRLADFDTAYRARYTHSDGRVVLDYTPLFVAARKK